MLVKIRDHPVRERLCAHVDDAPTDLRATSDAFALPNENAFGKRATHRFVGCKMARSEGANDSARRPAMNEEIANEIEQLVSRGLVAVERSSRR